MLRAAFQEYGQIENMRVPGKNFGFVQFATHAQVCGWQILFFLSLCDLYEFIIVCQAAAAIAARNGATPRGFSRPLRCTWASERRTPVAGGAAAVSASASPPPPPVPPPPVGYGYAPYPAPYPPGYMPPGPPASYPGFSGPGYPGPGYGAPPYMPHGYPPGGPPGYPPPSSYPPNHGPPRHDADGYNGDRRRDDRGPPDDKYGKMDKESKGSGSRNHPYSR